MKYLSYLLLLLSFLTTDVFAQGKPYVSKVWVADQGNGTFKNPVLNADYSDPDAIRVGDDYYLTSSSFEDIPGLPILHSKDLVNWSIIGHALLRQPPFEHFMKSRHGEGVWAPSLRYRKGEFYLYYPDPDFGIYLVKAKNPAGPWSQPILVAEGLGLIDPCPLWDEDGNVYLVHAFAGSRAGIKSVLAIRQLNTDGTKAISESVIVYDGHVMDTTIEGPKFYKRNGYYYIFAPAGGVSTGWQLVLRSKSVYGPYERKVVMAQGKSTVNGPHQGAWVTTQTGEDWFLHFQDKKAYGRVVHLNPMRWLNEWPVIGVDIDGDGAGDPVLVYKKPDIGKGKISLIETPLESDEFEGTKLGRQWQWPANPKSTWHFMNASKGELRLYTDKIPDDSKNLWEAPNVLSQKFPADSFMITTKLTFSPNIKLNEKVGLTVIGLSYANIALRSNRGETSLVYTTCKDAGKSLSETEKLVAKINSKQAPVYFRVKVMSGAACYFSYSLDGVKFTEIPESFVAEVGKWKGAKVGLFATRDLQTNDSGYADFDWFRVEAVN